MSNQQRNLGGQNMRPLFTSSCPVVLASASPRRQLFLRELGLDFVCRPAQGPESPRRPGEQPDAYALRLARAKADEVASPSGGELVIAADTIVVLRDSETKDEGTRVLGKPVDAANALHMLKSLNGRWHEVVTAVHVLTPEGGALAFAEASRVRFHEWPEAVLAAYVKTGEPFDKAGAYAVQGQGAFLVAAINGSWSTIVGLPVTRLVACLLEKGWLRVL